MIHLAGAKNRAADSISHHPSQGSDTTEGIHLPDDIAVVKSALRPDSHLKEYYYLHACLALL